jgi:dienelactone hydrolase
MSDEALSGFTASEFAADGRTRTVYSDGTGPAIIVIHEVPGLHPGVLDFARRVVDRGYHVRMPSLFGTPGKEMSFGYVLKSLTSGCISRDFTSWALDRTSPITTWLRALAADAHQECGGPGVGAVGMCFTGGFALGMMVDDIMVAPVLSQPSLPLPIGAARRADLNLSPDDLAAITERAANGCQVLGLRFTDDSFVGDRFSTLRDVLGDAFIAVELPSAHKRDHSVLTEQRDEASVQRVLDFFAEKLLT